jgi:hypothetical protein
VIDSPPERDNKDLHFKFAVQRRPLTLTSFVDNNQIVEGRGSVKLGPVLPRRARPRSSVPHPPKMPDEVGADISAIDYGVQWARKNL